MTHHVLKTCPGPFQETWDGNKSFELRKNDRNFQKGDTLELLEWNPKTLATGRAMRCEVLSVLSAKNTMGLDAMFDTALGLSYCVLGIRVTSWAAPGQLVDTCHRPDTGALGEAQRAARIALEELRRVSDERDVLKKELGEERAACAAETERAAVAVSQLTLPMEEDGVDHRGGENEEAYAKARFCLVCHKAHTPAPDASPWLCAPCAAKPMYVDTDRDPVMAMRDGAARFLADVAFVAPKLYRLPDAVVAVPTPRVFPVRRSRAQLKEALLEMNEQALFADGLEEAFVGICQRFGQPPVAAYDREKVLDLFVAQGMSEEEAEEFFEFNTIGAWVGVNTPVYLDLPKDKP